MIGQVEFTAALANAQAFITGATNGVAYANGTLFVADSNEMGDTPNNNRVLMFSTSQINAPDADISNITWSDASCHVCGYAAENVLGQPDFSSTNPGTANAPYPSNGLTAGWMQNATAVATDGHILAVADTDNNRILIWKSIPTAIDQPADLVLGQTSFSTSASPATPTASSVRGPQGIWIQNGKLFVADTQNYRVLIWNSIPTSNNQPADVVLGQTNFASGSQSACDPTKAVQTATASELCNPVSVTADNTHVFVADLGFNRVLIWNSIPTQNGQPANVVVGQLNMTTTVPNNSSTICYSNGVDSNGDATFPPECASTLNFPRFALSDGTRLFIADGGNDRVLIFNSIPTGNGALANEVLGQPDFVSDVNTSQTQTVASTAVDNTSAVDVIPTPTSLAYDGTNLYVSDPTDRRVLVFTPGNTQLPDNSVLNWASEIIRQEAVISLAGTIVANDTITVTIASANYTYTIKSTDSLDTAAQGLVSAINANSGDPNVTAIFAGVGTGSVYLSSKATNLGFDAISLAVTTSNTTDITATASGAYLSAGTGATAAPGMLVEIDGSNLSDQPSGNPVVAPVSGTLPTTLGGAQVYMDGLVSPLMSVSSTQIVAQVPYTFTDRSSTSVYVRTVHQDGAVTVTNATPVYIAPANPGLFNAPSYANQPRPWPASGALHQPGNPTSVVSIDGTAAAGDQATITVNGRNYTYTEVSGDTLESVVNALVKLINGIDPQVTAAPGAAFNRVVLTAIPSGAAGTGIPISGATNTGASVTVTPYTSSTCCAVTPGTLITPSNPAVAGELITLTATGLGTVEDVNGNGLPFPATGTPYEGTQPNTASNSVSATINGQTAEVVAAGLPQGSYGVYQVQLIVPSGFATTSAAQLYIAQNAFISNIVTIPVGAAVMVTPPPPPKPSPIKISIDIPSVGSSLVGVTHIGGWAFDSNAVITSVQILVDGVTYGLVQETGPRQDVCNVFQSPPGCPDLGWNYLLDTTQIANGAHTLEVTAYAADGLNMTVSTPVYVANPATGLPTHLFIDQPGGQDGAFQGVVTFSGWAFNDNGPIGSVTLTVDGMPVGQAQYGTQSGRGDRPDVCAVYPSEPGCPYVGWSLPLDTGTLTNGPHTLSVLATGPNGQHMATSSSFTVSNWSTANPMTVDIDRPSPQSAAFSGTVGFGGWAVDVNSPIGTIQVSVDGVSYGNASYGGYRPDVCQVLAGRPSCPNVGWNFLIDTTQLADGAHTLAITGTTAAGQSSTAAASFNVANFTASNPMRVFIDRPSPQSGPFSGSAAFSGWAISNNSAISTVQILVDGAIKGTATPGVRSDVCAAFPNANGCPNVGWNFVLDTTQLTNGSHTLQVMAISATGERGTAGESFTVENSAPNGPTWAFIDQPSGHSDPFLGLALFSGWAVDANAPIGSVTVSVDGVPLGNADYGVNSARGSRADVCATYSGVGCPNVGWSFLVDTTLLSDGAHSLGIEVTAADGSHIGISSLFIVANWVSGPNPMTVSIDNPSFLSTPFSGAEAHFGGWAIDTIAQIASISISVDGIPFGDASYGGARADVCAVYPGEPGCPNVGWDVLLDTTLLPNGSHTLGVTAISSTGQSSTITAGFSVAN